MTNNRSLRQGHRGPDVHRWQQVLLSKGFSPGALDGIFGPKTAKATRAFQATHGLKPDAIVGSLTFGKAATLGLRSLRRLTNAELTAALINEARRILASHHASPTAPRSRSRSVAFATSPVSRSTTTLRAGPESLGDTTGASRSSLSITSRRTICRS